MIACSPIAGDGERHRVIYRVVTAVHDEQTQRCPRVHFVWPDQTQPISWLTQPNQPNPWVNPTHGQLWRDYSVCSKQELTSWAYPAININSCLQALNKDISTPADIAPSALETIIFYCFMGYILPSVFWLCWFGCRNGIRPVKLSGVCWRSYLSGARCRLAYGPADATATHCILLASVKSRLVLPFWYRLAWIVPEKGPLNGCVCVLWTI